MTRKRKRKCPSGKILKIPYFRDKTKKGGAPMLYAGIDAHKRTCTIVIIGDQGRKIQERKVKTEKEAILNFFAPHKENLSAVVETCLNWRFIYRLLNGFISSTKVANSYKLRIIAEAKIKTDSLDAYHLAQLLRIGYIPEIFIPDEKTIKIRELIRNRVYLTRVKTRFKNKVHSLLDKNGFSHSVGTDLFGKAGRMFLRKLSIGNPEEGLIKRFLDLIERLEQDIKDLEIIVSNNVGNSKEIYLLRSIPGIGKIGSHLLLAEIGTIKRFRTKEKLCSFAGICPRIYSSGELDRRGHITKAGTPYIRWILTECAQIAIRHSPGLRRIFNKIKSKRGGKIAVIAVARRMLEIVFNVLTKEEEFDEIKAFGSPAKESRYACFCSTSRERSYIV